MALLKDAVAQRYKTVSKSVNRLGHGASAPWLATFATALLTALYYTLGPAPEILIYKRSAIADGELWRFVTGHLVHCDDPHFIWNVSAFLILTVYIENRSRHALIVSTATGIVAVSGYLWLFAGSTEMYCGLSGVLNTYMAAAVFLTFREGDKTLALIAGFCAFSKVAMEVFTPHALVGGISWEAVPEAHAAGLIFGGFLFMLLNSRIKPTLPYRVNNSLPLRVKIASMQKKVY